MTTPVVGPGATYDRGRYRQDEWLRGHSTRGIYAGHRIDDQLPVLITVRSHSWTPELVQGLRFDVPGVMPLLFVGPPDGYEDPRPNIPVRKRALIEERPAGLAISSLVDPLPRDHVVRIGLGLMEVLKAAAARRVDIQGIRPETVYVQQDAHGSLLTGIAPRAVRALGYQHDPPYALFDGHSYDAPELLATLEPSATSDLFSCALTLWFACTRKHAYRVSPDGGDEWVMGNDDRGPFTGPPELARILEPILQADVACRPSVDEAAAQFSELARQWHVERPLAR